MINGYPFSGICNYLPENMLPSALSGGDNDELSNPLPILHSSEYPQNVSYFDSSKKIDANNCAITMVRQKKRLSPLKINTPHVLLFIEFFNNRGKTLAHAHLVSAQQRDFDITNIGIVLIKQYQKDTPIIFKSKSETWVVSREKADRMWAQIKWEAKVTDKNNMPEEQLYFNHPEQVPHCSSPNPVPFCLLGQDSIGAKNIAVFTTEVSELKEMQNADPQKFQYLCNLLESVDNQSSRLLSGYNESPMQKIKNMAMELTVSKATEIIDYATGGMLQRILIPITEVAKTIGLPLLAITATYLVIKESTIYISGKYHKEELSLLKKNKYKLSKEIIKSNNCFTWARDKLAMVDIVLEKKMWEYLVAVPMPHLKEKSNF